MAIREAQEPDSAGKARVKRMGKTIGKSWGDISAKEIRDEIILL